MSGVTAEDVLAAALLDDLWDSEDGTPTLSEMVPASVVPVYMDAWEEYGNEWILPVSEARYQLECARRAVVVAAEHAVDGRLGLGRRMGWLRSAVRGLREAQARSRRLKTLIGFTSPEGTP